MPVHWFSVTGVERVASYNYLADCSHNKGEHKINREPNVRVLALSIRVVAVVITGKHGAMSNAIGSIWHKKCAIGRI